MDVSVMVHHLGAWASVQGPLHRGLATALMAMIRDGIVLPGTRLPAERPLAEALAISRTTVVNAYNALRTDGWLESRTGGGTWVSAANARSVRDRAQTAVLDHGSLMDLLSLDEDMVDLASGTTIPLASMVTDAIARSHAIETTVAGTRQYWPLGLPALRDAIARMYARQGLSTTADQVLVTCGAQQAISLVTTLLVQRGDVVLVETPTYFGALDAFRFAGARLAGVPVGERHVDSAMLRDRLFATGPRLIYLTPTYNNPTGSVMPESARRAVARLIEETGVTLVEDHALSDTVLEGSPPPVIAACSGAGSVLTIGSISKVCWAGLRVGWVRGPASVIRQLGRLKSAADLGGPLPTQAIAVPLVAALDEAKAARRKELRPRRDLLAALLQQQLPEWTFTIPSGGLFLWVKAPGVNTRQFAQYAARHRVALAPGALFSVDDGHEEYMRVPYLLDETAMRAGIGRLATAWRAFCDLAPRREARVSPLL
jgi:DNA-binding transcriptional MocR family regulator